MTGVGDDSRGRLVGRPWFVVGLALALAATLALVLADDIRYLRLGIVAALWAALVGAFLAVKYRRNAANTEEAVAQAQEVYELELEREIAARREYELEIESETRSRAASESRAELDALRSEVLALRDSLQSLFGGEVLLERVALTAQATRMRALREEGRLVEAPSGNGRVPAQLIAASSNEAADRPTELIERIREKQPTRGRPAAGAPEPRRPERSLDLPPRREQARPGYGRSAAASVSKAAAEARAEQTRVTPQADPAWSTPQAEPSRGPQAVRPGEPPRRAAAATELTQPALDPADRRRVRHESAGDEPTQLSKVLDADQTPSWESTSSLKREPTGDPAASNGNSAPATPEPQPAERPKRAETSRPRMQPARRFESSRPRMEPVKRAEPSRRFESSRQSMEPVKRAESSRPSMEPAKPPRRFESSRPSMEPVKRAETSRPGIEPAAAKPPLRFESSRPSMEPVKRAETSRPRIQPVGRMEPPPPPVPDELPPPSNPTLPVEVRRRAQEGG
ncbi:MAG TPA: DUF6779 domain-containing protein, partial [Amycolatopsis sp.]|nr:DUF6779 domain-containing protein [Amycolatopsis sp.]